MQLLLLNKLRCAMDNSSDVNTRFEYLEPLDEISKFGASPACSENLACRLTAKKKFGCAMIAKVA